MKRRSHVILIGALLAIPIGGHAFEMGSAQFELRGGALGGGGGVGAQSTVMNPTIGTLDAMVGQAGPIGISGSAAPGTELRMGIWHVVTVPEPGAALAPLSALLALANLVRRRSKGCSPGARHREGSPRGRGDPY